MSKSPPSQPVPDTVRQRIVQKISFVVGGSVRPQVWCRFRPLKSSLVVPKLAKSLILVIAVRLRSLTANFFGVMQLREMCSLWVAQTVNTSSRTPITTIVDEDEGSGRFKKKKIRNSQNMI